MPDPIDSRADVPNARRTTGPASDRPIAGRVAIVTGGAQGLGAAIVEPLADAGARVLIADLSGPRGEAEAARLRSLGHEVRACALDVGDDAQLQAAIERAERELGPLDVVVNNAAIDITTPIGEIEVADWDRVLRTNLGGPFLLARRAARAMDGRGGHIVNICSTASKRAWPNAAAYHATKWGLLGLSHALHAELRPRGIQVSAIVAGGMRTPFLLDRFPDLDPALLQEPANVARAVLFVLGQPPGTVVPELTVLPTRETSWP